MSVAHSGEVNQNTTFSGVNSFSISNQTSAGSDRMGVCHVGGFLGGSGTTSGTWGGSAMVQTIVGVNGDGVLLHFVAPPTSASTVTVNNLNGATGGAATSTYTGADQSAGSGPISNTTTATNTSTSPASVTCGTASGEMVVDAVGIDPNQSAAAGANQTSILVTNTGTADCLCSYQLGADGGVMSWTFTATRYWESVAASIKAAAAAAAYTQDAFRFRSDDGTL